MTDVRNGRGAAVRVALLAFAAAGASVLAWPHLRPANEAAAEQGTAAHFERLELITSAGVRALDVEVSVTPEKQALGLMYRTSLADDKGMLFPHAKPAELTMWMRNTYIPLDMVFIRADGTVHRIAAMTEPFSERIVASEGAVTAVLEIAGGAAARLGLKPGDKVRHPHFSTSP